MLMLRFQYLRWSSRLSGCVTATQQPITAPPVEGEICKIYWGFLRWGAKKHIHVNDNMALRGNKWQLLKIFFFCRPSCNMCSSNAEDAESRLCQECQVNLDTWIVRERFRVYQYILTGVTVQTFSFT